MLKIQENLHEKETERDIKYKALFALTGLIYIFILLYLYKNEILILIQKQLSTGL